MSKLALLGAGGPASSGGVWTSVYTWDTTAFANDDGYNGYTLVAAVPVAAFSQTGGTQIRLTFEGRASEGFIASAMYVGNGGGGDGYDFTGDQVQMLMSGSGTITVGAGVDAVTDAVAFVKDGSNPLIVAMQLQNGSADNFRRNNGALEPGTPGFKSYYKIAIEASTQNKTGYTANLGGGESSYIKKIELLF